ncbi:hypothetical protein CU098_009276 [Rhizopus stolonifer]|uniref:Uncharacterized protein n=1 Tax=Rhizopus stolonifer TaxID=4846 RepID=A0A367JKR6_RHIST|nr:hypothetical protein CU098_009276 [Rhizopus stolonifer]
MSNTSQCTNAATFLDNPMEIDDAMDVDLPVFTPSGYGDGLSTCFCTDLSPILPPINTLWDPILFLSKIFMYIVYLHGASESLYVCYLGARTVSKDVDDCVVILGANSLNTEMAVLDTINGEYRRHYTGSKVSDRVFRNFNECLSEFIMVISTELSSFLEVKHAIKIRKTVAIVKLYVQEHTKKTEASAENLEYSIPIEETILSCHTKLKKCTVDWGEINKQFTRIQLH